MAKYTSVMAEVAASIVAELAPKLLQVEMNIKDENCDPKFKRKITLEIEIDPKGVMVFPNNIKCFVNTKLAPKRAQNIEHSIYQLRAAGIAYDEEDSIRYAVKKAIEESPEYKDMELVEEGEKQNG